jgi:hypothetical protein
MWCKNDCINFLILIQSKKINGKSDIVQKVGDQYTAGPGVPNVGDQSPGPHGGCAYAPWFVSIDHQTARFSEPQPHSPPRT